MAATLNHAFELASDELGRIERELVFVEAVAPSSPPHVRDRAAQLKAFVYVWLAAITERFIRDTLVALLEEINAEKVRSGNLRISLYSMLCDSDLASIGSQSRQKSWSRRVGMFSRVRAQSEVAQFPENAVPLDGRTLRVDHLRTIWHVFGFRGAPVPHPRHGLALRQLAEDRNRVAHGAVPPVTFGRNKAAQDVRRLVSLIEDIVLHINFVAEEYLERRHYMHDVAVAVSEMFASLGSRT